MANNKLLSSQSTSNKSRIPGAKTVWSIALLVALQFSPIAQEADAQTKQNNKPKTEQTKNTSTTINVAQQFPGITLLKKDSHIKTDEDKKEFNKIIEEYLKKWWRAKAIDRLASAVYADKTLDKDQKFAIIISMINQWGKRSDRVWTIIDTDPEYTTHGNYESKLLTFQLEATEEALAKAKEDLAKEKEKESKEKEKLEAAKELNKIVSAISFK